MRFYRMHRWSETDSSCGFEFFTTRAQAEKAARAWRDSPNTTDEARGDIEMIEVAPTKAGILAALNRYASHNDNG